MRKNKIQLKSSFKYVVGSLFFVLLILDQETPSVQKSPLKGGLILSGGVPKWYAHIGVLKALEK